MKFGLSDEVSRTLFGPEATKRAQAWTESGKNLWCGTKDDPETVPEDGVFPYEAPPTTNTNWPGACPNPESQKIFDKALAYRMLFNDNESVCGFQAAARIAAKNNGPGDL